MAACSACHGFSATTPTKSFLTTTFTTPGMLRTERSLTLTTFAPTVGGRTTWPCSMPGTRTLCTNSNSPVTIAGMIDARHRRAEHRPLARVLAARRRAQREIELPPADQRSVRDAPGRVAPDRDGAVRGDELIRRHAQLLRRQPYERFARRRAGERQVGAIEVRRVRLRARRRALVGRHRGVALNQPHAVERHADFLGDQLHLRGVEALPELALAGVRGDDAVGADGDPRVQRLGGGAVDALRRDGRRACRRAGRR